MNLFDLIEIIDIEYENLEKIIQEINMITKDLKDNEPTLTEKTALAHYLMSVYNGIENLLKNICKYYNIPIPKGEFFHIELFKLFCSPRTDILPELISEDIKSEMQELRKFRHIARQGYAFNFEWNRMKEGVFSVRFIFQKFKENLDNHIVSLRNSDQ
jgi:hypothetical protein